jgi:hypothetical protein
VLRGPIGVLMDRQGNSLDRAILLATLLQRAGHGARLAHGELTADKVREFLPTLVARRSVYAGEPSVIGPPELAQAVAARTTPALRQEVPLADNQDLDSVTAQYQPVADAIGTRFKVRQDVGDVTELLSLVASETAGLLAALDKPNPMKDWNLRAVQAAKALADHWWVQVQDGEAWTDFEPGLISIC